MGPGSASPAHTRRLVASLSRGVSDVAAPRGAGWAGVLPAAAAGALFSWENSYVVVDKLRVTAARVSGSHTARRRELEPWRGKELARSRGSWAGI